MIQFIYIGSLFSPFCFCSSNLLLVCPLSADGTQMKIPQTRLLFHTVWYSAWPELTLKRNISPKFTEMGENMPTDLWKICFNFRPFWQHHTFGSCPTSRIFYDDMIQINGITIKTMLIYDYYAFVSCSISLSW